LIIYNLIMDDFTKLKDLKGNFITLAEEFGLENSISFLKEYFDTSKSNSIYYLKAFYNLFPEIPEIFFEKFTKASYCYFYSLLLTDKIIDNNFFNNREALLFAFVLQEKGLHILHDIYDVQSKFWSYFEKCHKEFIKAMALETRHQENIFNDYDKSELESIYMGKAAFSKVIPIAFAIESNQTDLIGSLEKSVDSFNLAISLKDDVNDWKEDFKNKQYSYVITYAINKNNLGKDPSVLTENVLGKNIFFTGIAEEILKLSLGYLNQAYHAVKDINCLEWKKMINHRIDEHQLYLNEISFIVKKQFILLDKNNQKRNNQLPEVTIVPFSPVNEMQQIKNSALNFIYRQWEKDFLEATVRSYFTDTGEFTFEKKGYNGDIFQRTVIIDILLDINENVQYSLTPLINYEIKKIINSRMSNNEGWNFYPGFDLQPPDGDTTAQVIQVLLKSGNLKYVEKYARPAIDLLLKYQIKPDGAIGTWIVPPDDKSSEKQKKQRSFFKELIGIDVDNSIDATVNANLFYGLYLWDKKKYKKVIEQGLSFIESKQQKLGCWVSEWYANPFYGTYACLRILKEVKPSSDAINRAFNFFATTQNSDGGWGYENNSSDQLSTALALISLSYLNSLNFNCNAGMVAKGLRFLRHSLHDEDDWEYCKFIAFGKTKKGFFKTKTITVSYILKALSCWDNFYNSN
jgi:squalene-hopene/tetraprenyl-beta-curcumene cyclase